MEEGKQLSMEKRLYETQIMRKALLRELDTIFKNIEYAQGLVEAHHQIMEGMTISQRFWTKLADKLADSKFYFLSSTFVVIKNVDELSKTTLKEHFEAHRPKQYSGAPALNPLAMSGALKNIKEIAISNIKPYRKYTNGKFDEYYGYFIDKISECIKDIERYALQNN